MRKILVTMLAVFAMTIGVAPPAVANFNDYTIPGWWNSSDETEPSGVSNWEGKWLYDDFPTTGCDDTDDGSRFQALWIIREGDIAAINDDTKRKEYRDVIAAANSAFSASNNGVNDRSNNTLHDKTPRWVVYRMPNGSCHPKFEIVEVPAAVYDSSMSVPGVSVGSPSPIWDYLDANTMYNKTDYPNRKWVTFIQVDPGGYVRPGASGNLGDADVSDNNSANKTTYVAISLDDKVLNNFERTSSAGSLAHELVHSLGGVNSNSGGMNTQSPGHANQTNDIMAYGDYNYPNAGEIPTCSHERQSQRLDCGDDHYFNKNGVNQSTATWWWVNFNYFLYDHE